jgi:hypothetical protein
MNDDDALMSGTMRAQVELDVSFHTPAKCIDAHRCSINPSVSVLSSEKKRLFGSHVLGGVGMSISSSSRNIEEMDDPGFRKDFLISEFHLTYADTSLTLSLISLFLLHLILLLF